MGDLMDKRRIVPAREYIVNFDNERIHNPEHLTEQCNTDDIVNKGTRSGEQLRTEEYEHYDLCDHCFTK